MGVFLAWGTSVFRSHILVLQIRGSEEFLSQDDKVEEAKEEEDLQLWQEQK